jgi:aerobic-type carbon monoxide dehydrogenase small subunit (CoxS/CutS family)
MIKKMLNVNGVNRMVIAASDNSLANVLRSQLGLTGDQDRMRSGPVRML